MPNLNIEKFVYSVKKEVLEAQEKHQNEQALFRLKSVDLEIMLGTTLTGEGGVDLVVVQLGSDVSKEQVHTVRLSFEVVENADMKKVKPGTILLEEQRDDIIRVEDLEYLGPLEEDKEAE